MAEFTYTALTKEGKRESATIAAPSLAVAGHLLKEQGLLPTQIQEKRSGSLLDFLKKTSTVSLDEKIGVVENLSIMLKAGISISRGMQILVKQTKNAKMKNILSEVYSKVQAGKSLSESMADYGSVFSNIFISMIKVGEEGGILDENLSYLAEELRKSHRLRKKIKGALAYPAFVTVATIGITGFISAFIFPKILPIFANFGAELPITTKALIVVSTFLLHYGLALLAGLFILAIFLYGVYLKTGTFRMTVDRAVLFMPIFGKMVKDYQMASFCRTFGLLLKSQLDVVKATQITANTLSNHIYKREVMALSASITKGKNISEHIGQNPYLFPEMVLQTLSVGESTGHLSDSLLYLSDYYENEVEETTRNLSSTLEPALMVVMGVVVGFVALAVITPIYQITQNIHP